MLPQRIKKAVTDSPKKLATLIDLVNLPSTLREFVGRSQSSRLGCFQHVWSYIKDKKLQLKPKIEPFIRLVICESSFKILVFLITTNAYAATSVIQDPNNKNIVHCDEKLKSILLGKTQVELAELPMLIKLHFPKVQK
ncbi:hypothetical protein R6Q59_022406 [Mikania micrantha]